MGTAVIALFFKGNRAFFIDVRYDTLTRILMRKQKKVLVVGGAGYIGGAVTDELQRRKIPYAVYDNLLYEDRHLKPGGDFIFGDVRDTKKLGKIIGERQFADSFKGMFMEKKPVDLKSVGKLLTLAHR